ncbi:MAG: alpha-glucan family phosphorylase [Candidatus Pacebacteria bacterium]|nr:alpha-glucan family phosphorylase [Candidatus Paceibacterota bacterium]
MTKHPIAYFSAEYGLDARLPIYAGGLGVLSGDTLKAAADFGQDLVAVGLLYRGKKAVQQLDQSGWQTESDLDFEPEAVGLKPLFYQGQKVEITLRLADKVVFLNVWEKTISPTVRLFLLDTNHQKNQLEIQAINDSLYFGEARKQFQQQLILGLGGGRLLQHLGLKPKVYHLNEGRAAFLVWELIRQLKLFSDLELDEIKQIIRSNLVYTNHTLVPAGSFTIPLDQIITVAGPLAQELGLGIEQLIGPGLVNDGQTFSPTRLVMTFARRHSGVSQLHTQLSKEIWPDLSWVNITNGVHLPTWQDERLVKLSDLSDIELEQIHQDNKNQLEQIAFERTGYHYDPNRLIVGWARRLAGYKRLDAVFAEIDQLAQILKNQDRPIQLLIAGKAHQEDERGKKMLQQVISYLSQELAGHALFIPNYDLDLARYMVRGCDVWLNLPERGKEACGTSGMKAISNGVLQCTTLDGWTDEVDWTGRGWVVDSTQVSSSLYQVLANQVGPLFYQDRPGWLQQMRRSIELAEQFSAKRMFSQYLEKLYLL